jgi:putative ABC transport system permease protein
VLRANRSNEGNGGALLRNVLVISQFAISIGLIICTITIYAQTIFAKQADPGFQRTGLLQVDNLGTTAARPVAKTFEAEVRRLPGVVAAAQTIIGVETDNRSFNAVVLPGQTRSFNLGGYAVEPGFFETMGLKLLAGRSLSENNGLDDATLVDPNGASDQQALVARGLNVVVSRLAAKRLGFDRPEDAIGKHFADGIVDSRYGVVPCTIVGVVEDARWHSVREAVDPIVYFQDKSAYHYLEVRFAAADPAKVREQVERVWKRLLPETPFAADFADARAARQYREDDARATLFACFAALSVIIGCLGLFGLASFTAERRTKEIGIRKVLGARTRDIMRLLVWQFSRPVLIANLIAWPVAWWLMRDWLNTFDARIALSPAPFLLAGGLALVIAVGTIASHAFRVARTRPIHALRYE